MSDIILAWLITNISFLIISRLPLAIEIDGFKTAILNK